MGAIAMREWRHLRLGGMRVRAHLDCAIPVAKARWQATCICLGRVIPGAKGWWRNINADTERRTNLLFLFISSFLTVMAIASFCWLVGVIDWRGSTGQTLISFNLSCDEEGSDTERNACHSGIEESDQILIVLDLAAKSGEEDSVDVVIGKNSDGETPDWALKPHTRIGMVSSRNFSRHLNDRLHPIERDGELYSTYFYNRGEAQADFTHGNLTRFTGLSERDFSIYFVFTNTVMITGKSRHLEELPLNKDLSVLLKIFPPDNFDIADATPPAERSIDGGVWTMHFKSRERPFLFRARMRNYDAARLDHILDASIPVLLGAGVGGLMSSYVALALLRKRRPTA